MHSTRDKILEAARQEFVEKGYAGARMQTIANRANANKAMIYYYFNSKDILFQAVFKESFYQLFHTFRDVVIKKDTTIEQIVEKIVEIHIDFLEANPSLPILFIREMHQDNPVAQEVIDELFSRERIEIQNILLHFHRAIEQKKIRDVDIMNAIWSLLGMNIFYFVAKPVVQKMWNLNPDQEHQLLQERKKEIVNLFLNGILAK